MRNKQNFSLARVSLINLALAATFMAFGCAANSGGKAMVIQEQGSFAAGGIILQKEGTFNPQSFTGFVPQDQSGQTLHGDHGAAYYQIPANARRYSLVFLPGFDQSIRCWQTTPDGREGFQNIFLRRRFATYLIEQPRRGTAGKSTVDGTVPAVYSEQLWFNIFRIGIWPDYFENAAFPRDKESLERFFRQATPNIAPFDLNIVTDAAATTVERAGESILVTHSQGGLVGWFVPLRSDKVKAVVSYEPGGFVFPAGEVPEPIPGKTGGAGGFGIPMDDFIKLTKIPMVLYFGDNIIEEESEEPGYENWRVRLQMARKFVDSINRHGGDAVLVELPKIGVYGNTHFPFSDTNNLQIADLLSGWLREKKLDR